MGGYKGPGIRIILSGTASPRQLPRKTKTSFWRVSPQIDIPRNTEEEESFPDTWLLVSKKSSSGRVEKTDRNQGGIRAAGTAELATIAGMKISS